MFEDAVKAVTSSLGVYLKLQLFERQHQFCSPGLGK